MSQPTSLAKTLTLPQAIGLAITLVVGSGLLALPGLAYRESGASAIYAWLITAAISVPFLIVFARLGSRLPGAGGVAGFMQSAFSRRVSIPTEFLLIGTFVVGGPATIVTGGLYFAAATGLGQIGVALGAAGILIFSTAVNYMGARVSGRIQQIMATGLVLLLVGIAVASLVFGTRAGVGIAPIREWTKGVPFIEQALLLPNHIRRRLTIEHEERAYNLADVLAISRQTDLPVVYDNLHYDAYPTIEPLDELLPQVFATWDAADGVPEVHFSSQAVGARLGSHAEFVNPQQFRAVIDQCSRVGDFDVMLEAKGKDEALQQVLIELKAL